MCVCLRACGCVRGRGGVGGGGRAGSAHTAPAAKTQFGPRAPPQTSPLCCDTTHLVYARGGRGRGGPAAGVDGAEKKRQSVPNADENEKHSRFFLLAPQPPLLSHSPCLSWRPPAPPPTPSRGWTSSELAGFLFFEWTEWKSSPVARHTRHAHPADATCEPPRGGRRWGEGAAPAGDSTQGFPINRARHRVSTYPLSPSAAPAPSTRSPTRRTSSKRCAARWRQTT